MPTRPLRLPDTTAQAGYHELDPITQWHLGGVGTAGAEATGLDDDSRYGLDLLNVGSGGQALRATSGNGTHQVRVNNSGVSVFGGLSVTGGALTVAGITSTNGFVVTTGATVLGGSLSVTGAATFSTAVTMGASLAVTGPATFGSSASVTGTLTVTGAATFSTAVTMNGTLNVTGGTVLHSSLVTSGPATFGTTVTIQGTLNCDSNVNLGNAIGDTVDIAGPLRVTGTATFVTNVTMQQNLTVVDSLTVDNDVVVNSRLTVEDDADFNSGSIVTVFGTLRVNSDDGAGFTEDSWSGCTHIQIPDGGGGWKTVHIPYLESDPTP